MPPPVTPTVDAATLPSELRLLLACARWPPSEENASGIRTTVTSVADWEFFLLLCAHHRVSPLVYRSLRHAVGASSAMVPQPILTALKVAATRNTHSALRYLSETQRLCTALKDAGVPVRVLKGVPLSHQIYRDPGVRDVGDIDLLIASGTEEAADEVLLADGFRRQEPAAVLTPRRRRVWSRHQKDYTYAPERNGFEVDLHWRLFRNRHMPGNGLTEPATSITDQIALGGALFDVLPLERSFLFLCVSGALDGWFRFKALVDVSAAWAQFSIAQQTGIVELAREHGVLPEMAAALRLALNLGLLEAESIPAGLQLQAETREARLIVSYAGEQHSSQQFRPSTSGAGSWALKRYEVGLRRNFAYRWAIVKRVLVRPRMWERFDLPDTLFPLYPLLSPVEWVLWHRGSAERASRAGEYSSWRRFRTLPWKRRALLVESFLTLLGARVALRLLPPRKLFRWIERPLRRTVESADPLDAVEAVRWAVLTVTRYGPVTFVCFPQALAAHRMLRSRHVASTVHYGVRRSADGQLRAHAWLEVNGRMLLGGESAALFAPVRASRPGGAER